MGKKLRSQKGIAMIFAIVGFVVVMVIGVVFLTAGYANYSKLFGRKNDRQDYYTLVSAAKYAGSQLDGATIKITEVYDDDDNDGNYASDERNKAAEPSEPEIEGQDDWSVDVVRTMYDNQENETNASYDLTFSNGEGFNQNISVEITGFDLTEERFIMTLSTADGKNTVQVDFTLSPAYGESTSLIDKDEDGTKDTNRRTNNTTYTIRMGDIQTVNGGSST